MVRLHVTAACLVAVAAAGCGGGGPSMEGPGGIVNWSDAEPKVPGIDQASIYYLGSDFVIWSDLGDGGVGASSSNQNGVACKGRMFDNNGRELNFRMNSQAPKTGEAVINGQTYSLQQGGLFLVAQESDTIRVKQLQKDLTSIQFDPESLRKFARSDSDIANFFAGSIKQSE